MLKGSDYPEGHPIYCYVDDTGRNIHIDSDKLRLWCLEAKPEIFLVPVERSVGMPWLKDDTCSRARVAELLNRTIVNPFYKFDPIIFARNDGRITPDTMLVDGHHRYLLAVLKGQPFIKSFVLTPSQWHPFEVEGLLEVSQEELLKMPSKKRNY